MGSVTASDPAPEFFATHAYAAAKGATTALMTTMAATYAARRIRVNVVRAIAHATRRWRHARRATRDPRLQPAQAAARRRDDGPGRGRPRRGLLPVRRVAGGDRAAAQGRRRLVGASVSPEPPEPDDLRPDRPRRHRPVRARRDVRPRARRHRRRAAGRRWTPTSTSATSTRWRPRCAEAAGLGLRTRSSMPCRAMPAATPASSPSSRRRTGVHVVAADRAPPRPLLRTGALEPPRSRRGRSPTCSSLTSPTGSTRSTTRGRSSAGPPSGRAWSRSPAAMDGPSERDRLVFEAAAAAHRADRRPDPHPLRGGHRRARAGPSCWRTLGVDPSHVTLSHVDKVVDRGYHREHAGDRRDRRVRPVVPLGRRAERHARADRLDGRGRVRRPDRARDGRGAAGLLPRRTAGRPG